MEYVPIVLAQKDKTNNQKLSSPFAYAHFRKSRIPADMDDKGAFRNPGGSDRRTLTGVQGCFQWCNCLIFIKA